MIYTNEKVFREFGKLLTEGDREKVQKVITRAKDSANSEEKQVLNDAIFELQNASRILTGVMLYNPMKLGAPTDTSS
ncbi:MAG: hypothetical protein ACXW28_12785 [Thermoanaerobaculia bacterium]